MEKTQEDLLKIVFLIKEKDGDTPYPFYEECLWKFHERAKREGYYDKNGHIFSPVIAGIASSISDIFIHDTYLQMQYGFGTPLFYYVVMGMCINSGMAFAEKLHLNGIDKEFISDVIKKGPSQFARPLMKKYLKINTSDDENVLYNLIFNDFKELFHPYINDDNAPVLIQEAMNASLELGASLILSKMGYPIEQHSNNEQNIEENREKKYKIKIDEFDQNNLFSEEWWKNVSYEEIKDLLDLGVSFSQKQTTSSLSKDVAEARKKGIFIECTNDSGRNALMIASKVVQDSRIIDLLIQSGVDPNETDHNGVNALMLASRINTNIDVIKTLIDNTNDIDKTDKSFNSLSALAGAIEYNENPEVIETLIENGADLLSRVGTPPILRLKYCKSLGVVKVIFDILKKGLSSDIDAVNMLLSFVVGSNHIDILKFVINQGANVNYVNLGRPVFFEACSKCTNPEVIKLFIENGVDVNAKDERGKTALIVTIESFLSGTEQNAKILIENGADLDIQDNEGKTALMYAIQKGKGEIVCELILRGADTTLKDTEGNTAMKIAKEEDDVETIKLLKSKNKNFLAGLFG